MTYDADFARLVLLHVSSRLADQCDTAARKARQRWVRANIPTPNAARDYPPEHVAAWAIRELDSPDPYVRFAAVRILGALEWVAPEANMPEAAGQLMADLGSESLRILTSKLTSVDPTDRRIAMYGIAHLRPQALSTIETIARCLERSPLEVASTFVEIGDAATGWMIVAVRHPRNEVRAAALRAIESPPIQWPTRVARSVLDAVLEILNEADEETAHLAADALESCGCGGDDIVAYYKECFPRLNDVARARLMEVIRTIED
ncbi:MAG: hypothetical protein IPH09_11895 [bacterium]|nr:hypothetical protein [bacterium]